MDFRAFDFNRDSYQPSGFSTEGLAEEFVNLGDSEPIKINLKNSYCKFTEEEKMMIVNSLNENTKKGLKKGKRFNKIDADFLTKNALFFKKFEKNRRKLKIQNTKDFDKVLSSSYTSKNLKGFNEYIGNRILNSQLERRKFLQKKLSGKISPKMIKSIINQQKNKEVSNEKTTLGPHTTEDFSMMKPVTEIKNIGDANECKPGTSTANSDLWKYKNFKFPSPFSEGCNKVISFNINKKSKKRDISADDIYEIFGIQPKQSQDSFFNKIKVSQSAIIDDSGMLSKRLYRNWKTPISRPNLEHNCTNDERSESKMSHSVIQRRRDLSFTQDRFINRADQEVEQAMKMPHLKASTSKKIRQCKSVTKGSLNRVRSKLNGSCRSKGTNGKKRDSLQRHHCDKIFHRLKRCNIFQGRCISPMEARAIYLRDKIKSKEEEAKTPTHGIFNSSPNSPIKATSSSPFINALN
ncbi:unnamed protein product [Moneuplotes crassus]|uniref:Uncharacterized protein n=1 Tax=Euplotes crassus TaxID=5936 RepID=A0AAD1UPP4_EUPCR|nr:unnamed protein product [Moneuplotes crassus]